MQLPYCLLADGNALVSCIHVSCYLFSTITLRLIFFLYFQIKYSSFLQKLYLLSGFYLVNSECGAHLAVDLSLIYGSTPKMFLLFFSRLEPNSSFKTIFLDSYLGIVVVCFLLLDLLEFCDQLSQTCKPCLPIFNSQQNECYPIQTKRTQLLELANSYKLRNFEIDR